MAKTNRSWTLVIDASVTSAASWGADLTASSCRDLLKAILTICHKLVFNAELQAEWKRHRSSFAKTWRTSMAARKKLVACGKANADEQLWQEILATAENEKEYQALAKDLHLIQAALATDGIILSRDKIVRALLERAAARVPRLRQISWINPDEDEGILEWLESGKIEASPYLLGGKRDRKRPRE